MKICSSSIIFLNTFSSVDIGLKWYAEQNVMYGYCAHGYDLTTVTTLASVPEPTTMLLLGSGLIGLIVLRKKFKR